jgi:hypothetical protein
MEATLKTLPRHLCAVLAAGLVLSGCSSTPTGPLGGSGEVTGHDRGAPNFERVEARYGDGVLHVVAVGGGFATMAPFSAMREGGWCFQLFMDSDQGASGYGTGYDFLVRAIEVGPGGSVHVRRTEGGGGPGGWGESVGRVALQIHDRHVDFTVPLAAIDDDGELDFAFEIYRTIRLPEEDGGGLKHEFIANFAGASVPYDRTYTTFSKSVVAIAPFASRVN